MGVGVSGERRAVQVRVRGRVQHVGFRWFVARAARGLAVSGWVRNAEDGTVEVAAEGTPAQVDQLLAALRRGPSQAVVQAVEIEERPLTAATDHTEFEILP
ncbi:MAG: acylphosphatase [Gemmatimonadetes bacterium]|nr:acylphosphatase [Gemmatimonadota bacterium]